MSLWTAVLLLALPFLVAGTTYECKDDSVFLMKENDCLKSGNHPGSYSKGDKCTVRLSVNRRQAIRLEPTGKFQMRPNQQCHWDRFKYYNMANPNFKNQDPKGYYLGRLCKKDGMHGSPKALIMNTHQARMVFTAAKKGNAQSLNGKKWKVCLKPRPKGNEVKDASCDSTYNNFVKGKNMRLLPLTNTDTTKVTKVCCQTSDLSSKDYATMACANASMVKSNEAVLSSSESCIYCHSDQTEVEVAADISYNSTKKEISCTCTQSDGLELGEACSSADDPCLDTENLAFCDLSTCVCPTDYTPSFDNTYCTKNVTIGGDCSNGENCVSTYGRATCDGSVCECPSGYLVDDYTDPSMPFCYQEVEVGGDCSEEGSKCVSTYNRSACVSNTCQCQDSTADGQTCLKFSDLGEECEYDDDCKTTDRSECDTGAGECVCQSSFTEISGECSYNSIVGGTCEKNLDCTVTNSKCNTGTNECECKSTDYKANNSGKKCNAVCTMTDGTQISSNAFICNEYQSGSKKCSMCKCNDPPSKMDIKQSKSKCNLIASGGKTCSSSGVVKYTVKNGNKCGE